MQFCRHQPKLIGTPPPNLRENTGCPNHTGREVAPLCTGAALLAPLNCSQHTCPNHTGREVAPNYWGETPPTDVRRCSAPMEWGNL